MSLALALRRTLERALLFAGVAGCCVPIFAKPIDGRYQFQIRALDPALAARATVDARGFFDGATCNAACGTYGGGDSRVCYPAQFAPGSGAVSPNELYVACGEHYPCRCSTEEGPLK
jgi:hypothetical protein